MVRSRGRPARADTASDVIKRVPMTDKEDQQYSALARHCGVTFSELVRSLLRRELARLERNGEKVPKK